MSKPLALAVAIFLASWVGSGEAASIQGLFDTGVDGGGGVLPGGAVDPHYTLISSADPAHPGPDAIVASVIPSAYWAANNTTSKWIAPAADENYPALGTAHPGGAYIYRLSFDLTGFDPGSVSILGTWGKDNSGEIRLNGAATGNSSGSYNPLAAFTVSSGFVAGVNHLDFVVTNFAAGGSNPTGLRVQGITGTGSSTVGVGRGGAGGALELAAPAPNPARATARLSYTLPRACAARLAIRDLAGRTIRTLVAEIQPAGRFEVGWDGLAADGTRARAGIYVVELQAEGSRVSRRIAWIP